MNAKRVVGAIAILFASVSVTSASQAATYAYVSNADSQDISVFQLDKSNGSLAPVETVNVGGTVMRTICGFMLACARSLIAW
jgi:6-phosphogluconolactonase